MSESRPQLFGVLAGLFLATGLVCSAVVLTRAWMKIAERESINVTGSARKSVQSDLIVWRGSFSAEGPDLLAAQRKLKSDLVKVEQFLNSKSVTNYLVGNVGIQELRSMVRMENETVNKLAGYRLSQAVEIRSAEVARIADLDRETVQLVEAGVLFTSESPQYIYTKAGEAKVEMLAEATRDARSRADQIAAQGGREIRRLQSARMGVFQITPLHSIQTSWDGMNDTSSFEKTITAVVTATFGLE